MVFEIRQSGDYLAEMQPAGHWTVEKVHDGKLYIAALVSSHGGSFPGEGWETHFIGGDKLPVVAIGK